VYDLLVRGGTVVDGTGAPPRTADIAVRGGQIVEIGHLSGPATRIIDADGALVTPGWVDAHTHYDAQVTWDDRLEGSAANGVTSVVMGNCGVGFAPVRTEDTGELIDLMEGVEDIPGSALIEGMPWGEWQSFPEYLAFLSKRQWSMDVAAQVPHGALRYYVMGERAVNDARATAADVTEMVKLVEEAVRAGAVGFSTSRTIVHQSMSGRFVPGTFALEDELTAIASAVVRAGATTVQAISASGSGVGTTTPQGQEHASVLEEIAQFGRISRTSGATIVFTTVQARDQPNAWRDALSLSGELNRQGARLAPMVAPRGSTLLTTLEAYHGFMRRPTYLRLKESLSFAELVSELHRHEIRSAILAEEDVPHQDAGSSENTLPGVLRREVNNTFPLTVPINYEPELSSALGAQALSLGCSSDERLYDFLLEDEGHSVGVIFGTNYREGNLDACREMLLHETTVSGLSDAGAHVTFICDMSVPTFQLAHWTRDRTRGPKLPVELVVAKSTSMTARAWGLDDRGVLLPGKRADLNVIDMDRLQIGIPRLRWDLPAGGARFLQTATGYVATVVNGHPVREQDVDTGARPGRLLRRSTNR